VPAAAQFRRETPVYCSGGTGIRIRSECPRLPRRVWRPFKSGHGSPCCAASRSDRHREDLATVFIGEVGSNESTAGQIGFNNHCPKGHAGDDTIADRKGLFIARAIERELSNQSSIGGNPFVQLLVRGRPDQVEGTYGTC